MITPRDLAARAAGQHFTNEADINRWLQAQGITDPTERLSYKIELMAQGALATDQHHAPGTLAPDLAQHTTATAPVSGEMRRWLQQAALSMDRTWSEHEITQALSQSGLDTVEKMAVRAELYDRKCVRAAGARPGISAGRDMSASVERPRGRVLKDPDTGEDLVLRGTSW